MNARPRDIGRHAVLKPPEEAAAVDLRTKRVLGRVPLSAPHYGIDVSPDGRRVFATGVGGHVLNVIGARRMERVAQVEVGQGSHGVRTSDDGDSVHVAVTGTNELVVVDPGSRRVVHRVPMPGTPFWVAVGRR